MNRKSILLLWCTILAYSSALLPGIQKAKIYFTLEEAVPQTEKPVMLVFFSTACSVCWEDLFEMKYFIEKNSLPCEVVGITRVPREELEPFLEKYSFDHPVVFDARSRLYRRFKVELEPYKIILVKGAVIYQDDCYQEFLTRREQAKRCLFQISSR